MSTSPTGLDVVALDPFDDAALDAWHHAYLVADMCAWLVANVGSESAWRVLFGLIDESPERTLVDLVDTAALLA